MFVKSNYMYVSEPDATSFWLAIKFLSKRFRVSKAPASDSASGPSEFAVAFFFYRIFFLCPSHLIFSIKNTLLLGSDLRNLDACRRTIHIKNL